MELRLISLSKAIEPVGGYTTASVTHGQCDARRVTFPANGRYQFILLGEQRHIVCEQLAQSCYVKRSGRESNQVRRHMVSTKLAAWWQRGNRVRETCLQCLHSSALAESQTSECDMSITSLTLYYCSIKPFTDRQYTNLLSFTRTDSAVLKQIKIIINCKQIQTWVYCKTRNFGCH